MHNSLEEQMHAIDEDMVDAVLNGNELMISKLQKQREEFEHLLFGNGPIA